MNLLKALYISVYMMALAAGAMLGTYALATSTFSVGWAGVTVSSAAQLAFFMRLFLWPTARTTKRLPLMLAASAISGLAAMATWMAADRLVLATLAAGLGVVMPLLYVHWYSSFGSRDGSQLRRNGNLPAIELTNLKGQRVPYSQLVEARALWMFYRGNWCPLCMAQIREVASQYQELARRGVNIYLISPQPPEHTEDLARKFEVPMQFFVDVNNQAARRLGILAENGLPTGLQALGYDSDVPMPTVFITEVGGRIIYADLTENYRIRPEPQEFLAELDRHGLTT